MNDITDYMSIMKLWSIHDAFLNIIKNIVPNEFIYIENHKSFHTYYHGAQSTNISYINKFIGMLYSE